VVPPGARHDPKFVGNTKYDPAAKALLDKLATSIATGRLATCRMAPLVLKRYLTQRAERQYDELCSATCLRSASRSSSSRKVARLLKMARGGQLQMWQLGNRSGTTEGYGFLSLLYGGNSGLANLSRFKQPDFDRLYDASRKLPDGPERARLTREMSQIVAAYAPWKLNAYRYENIILYPRVEGYKLNVFNIHPWQYLDVVAKTPRESVE
jgi:hypothetical protein